MTRTRMELMVSVIIFCLLLISCSKKEAYETNLSAEQILDRLLLSQESSLSKLEENETIEYYGITQAITQSAASVSKDAKADEIAVFMLSEDADVKKFKEELIAHQNDRISAFTGYAPYEESKAENGEILAAGNWICFIISDQTETMREKFYNCFSKEAAVIKPSAAITSKPTPSIIESNLMEPTDEQKNTAKEMYDNSEIVNAYEKKNPSLLTGEKQKKIYEMAEKIISTIITDDMSDYEKEKAVHDYMIDHGAYDEKALEKEGAMSEDADNPYGFLIHGYGICSGYTTTFQLFMDLLKIPCISIKASSGVIGHEEDHAWNMVNLDGAWYYVDVTWDDPLGKGSPKYSYFNTTTSKMILSGHIWEYESYPSVKEIYQE